MHNLLWILPLAVVVLLVILAAVAFRLLGRILERREQHFFTDRALRETPWAYQIERFRRDQDWMARQEWEDLWITSHDGLRLHASLLPAPNGSRRTFLAFHGYLSSGRNDFSFAVPLLHERGYNVVLADDRAHGQSEGKWIALGLRERFDCRDWARYLEQRLGPDAALFLGGISMGATMVLMAAGLPLPDSVKGIVADCGFDSPFRMSHLVQQRKYGFIAGPLVCMESLLHKILAGYTLHAMTTERAMKTNRTPILFVHGDADNYVPPSMTRRAYDACRTEKHLFLGRGARHTFSWVTDTEAYTTVFFEFLDRH